MVVIGLVPFGAGEAHPMEPSCHEQVLAGDLEDQTFSTGQIGRRDLADRYFVENTPNPISDVCVSFRMGHSRPALIDP